MKIRRCQTLNPPIITNLHNSLTFSAHVEHLSYELIFMLKRTSPNRMKTMTHPTHQSVTSNFLSSSLHKLLLLLFFSHHIYHDIITHLTCCLHERKMRNNDVHPPLFVSPLYFSFSLFLLHLHKQSCTHIQNLHTR